MRRNDTHGHRCTTCGQEFDCCGTIIDNFDGFPRYPCEVFDVRGERECAACFVADACGFCGAKNIPLTEVQFDGCRYCVEGSACDVERLEDATKALDDIGPAPTPAARRTE